MNLDGESHGLVALWAADCAERVLPYFDEEYPEDDRPRKAVEAARAWVRDEIDVSEARDAAFAAHAAARDADQTVGREAARATGHAAATPHVADHATHAASYAIKAVTAATDADTATDEEREWQIQQLPKHLRPIVFPDRGDN